MSEQLVSASWHRVAGLTPSLVPGLRIVRQQVRDQVWQQLVEPVAGKQMRLNPAAYDLVGRFDGRATVSQLWERLLELRREEAPTQDEVLQLVAQLFRAGMVQFDAAPHLSMMFARREQEGRQRRGAFVNPLFMRTKLADPGPLLNRLAPLAEVLFSRTALVLWLIAMLWALLAAGTHYGELKAHALQLVDAPRSFLLAWVCYPLVKLLHEMGHGLAVRRFGGEVREVGMSLMFLVPAPYVDASAANSFPSARQRMVVSAAGILVETSLAAAALVLWMLVSAGPVRDAAMVVVLIGFVSTLAFNANPLLRLDGYHILCDALQLPNLASRSQAWWLRQWLQLLRREQPPAETSLSAGERKWLLAYAPLSWLYRVALLLTLISWVGGHSWLLGWAAAIFVIAWLSRRAWLWLAAAGVKAQRAGLGVVAGALVLLVAVPAPQSVVTRGVVWPPPSAQLRAQTAGFVEEVVAKDGAQVNAGDAVLTLRDPVLLAQRERIASEQMGLRTQQYSSMLSDPAGFQRLDADVKRTQAELARSEEQIAQLEVRSGMAGHVSWSRPQDLPGSYAKRGALLGHVVVPGTAHVRFALPEDEFLRVRGNVRGVQVVLAETPFDVREAQLLPQLPGATQELPSPALGDKHGGPIPVESSDKEGVRSRVPVFVLDVALQDHDPGRIGGRAWVKLDLPAEPVGWQLWHRLRQLFVRQFNPSGQL